MIAPTIAAVLVDAVKDYSGQLVGIAYDHAIFDNGTVITTSPVVKEFRLYLTESGSYYMAEDVNEKARS